MSTRNLLKKRGYSTSYRLFLFFLPDMPSHLHTYHVRVRQFAVQWQLYEKNYGASEVGVTIIATVRARARVNALRTSKGAPSCQLF